MATIEDGTEMAGFERLSEFARLSARHDADLDLHGIIILVLRRCFHLDQPVVSKQL